MENNIDCRKFRLYISKKIKTISPPTRGYLFKFKKHFFFHLRKLCKSCLYYDEFFLASLRFNLHRIKYTHLKCIVWWVLVIMYDCKTTTTIFILLCFALLLFIDNCFFFFFNKLKVCGNSASSKSFGLLQQYLLLLNYSFHLFQIYAQEWDCWITWQLFLIF